MDFEGDDYRTWGKPMYSRREREGVSFDDDDDTIERFVDACREEYYEDWLLYVNDDE